MTSPTRPKSEHPLQWTKESASRRFPVPIQQGKDRSIGELLKDLHPKWLVGGVKIEQAMLQACKDHTPGLSLEFAMKHLRCVQTLKTWHGDNMEDHVSNFCFSWLKALNEPRELRRYRNRCV
jgi:hypothetical protein